jgi:hypothetical protein
MLKTPPERFLLPEVLFLKIKRTNAGRATLKLKESTMCKMKEVTPQQFYDRFNAYKDKVYCLQMRGWEVVILHGLISLVADHPGIKAMQGPTHQAIDHVRLWCNNKFALWGFTPEEVEYLDNMREVKAGESSLQDQERQRLDLWTRIKSKIWHFDIQSSQITNWFEKNTTLTVGLPDFEPPVPPARFTVEILSLFCESIDRHAGH